MDPDDELITRPRSQWQRLIELACEPGPVDAASGAIDSAVAEIRAGIASGEVMPKRIDLAGDPYEPTPEDHAELDAILDELRDDLAAGRLSPEELAALEAIEPGMVASLSAPAGLNGHAHANGYGGNVLDLSNAASSIDMAANRGARRAAEDLEVQPRTTEKRLERCYARIMAGSYSPGAFEFSGGASGAGRALAEARWQRKDQDFRQSVTGAPACGVVDQLGRCGERFHRSGCGSIADPAVAQELIEAGAYKRISGRPMIDSNGRAFRSQWNTGMDMASLLEGMTGERLAGSADGLFESGSGRRELLLPRRHPRYGDPDDPEGYDSPMPAATRRTAAALAAQAGLTSHASEARAQYKAERERRLAQLNPRWIDPRTAESPRERRERMHQPVEPVPVGDMPWNGSLPMYAAGQL